MSNKAKPMPSLEVLSAAFDLDSERGVLLRKREGNGFKAGEICGTKMPSGHLQTYVAKKRYLVHRIIYFMATGIDLQDMMVDHINGVPDDNRICNLRLASKAENSRHKVKLSAKNTSGHRNVSWSSRWNCWLVTVRVNGKSFQRHFHDLAEAVKAAVELRAQHHGNFAGLTT